MEEVLVAVTVPAIVILVYWFINLLKYLIGEKEHFLRGIPLIASFTGAVLGVILFYFQPDIMLAENVINAIIVGGASGLAATGTNQVLKQLSKFKVDNDKESKATLVINDNIKVEEAIEVKEKTNLDKSEDKKE